MDRTKKICPLLMPGRATLADAECLEERCAWWILSVARSVRQTGDAPGAGPEYRTELEAQGFKVVGEGETAYQTHLGREKTWIMERWDCAVADLPACLNAVAESGGR